MLSGTEGSLCYGEYLDMLRRHIAAGPPSPWKVILPPKGRGFLECGVMLPSCWVNSTNYSIL